MFFKKMDYLFLMSKIIKFFIREEKRKFKYISFINKQINSCAYLTNSLKIYYKIVLY